MAKAKKTAVKTRKKRWFTVVAPKIFLEQVIGEVPGYEIQELIGKKLTINMMTLTREPKKQGMAVTFTVTEPSGDKCITEVTGYQILPSTIKRMVRRGKDRIDLSLKIKLEDGGIVQLKPIVLTRAITKGSVTTAISNSVKIQLQKIVSKMTYDSLLKDVINHKIQSQLFDKLKKIYPIAVCEIRVLKKMDKDARNVLGDTVEEEPAVVEEEDYEDDSSEEAVEETDEETAEESLEEKKED